MNVAGPATPDATTPGATTPERSGDPVEATGGLSGAEPPTTAGRLSILFLSGTSVGGAARSTHELAAALVRRGHTVAVLSAIDEAARRRRIHKRLLDGAVRLGGPLGRGIHAVRQRVGRRLEADPRDGYRAWRAAVPENALRACVESVRPDLVVVSSIERPAWRQIHAFLADRRLPCILYLRERTAIGHLVQSQVAPDLVLANAEGHAEAVRAAGYGATVVPSIVDVANCRTDTSRDRVVFINPVQLFGLDIALALAAARPDIAFTFARSWPLTATEEQDLFASVAALPNVEIAERLDDPRQVYARARVVLVPYRHPGRPRVVAEAHASAIPVLGSDSDGTAEAIGPGGSVVALDAPIAQWVHALGVMWDDVDNYERLVDAARTWAARPEIQTDRIVEQFEVCALEAMARSAR